MSFDDLARMWRDEESGDFVRTRLETLSDARDRFEKINTRVRRKDRGFTVFEIVLFPILVSVIIRAPTSVQAVGSLLIAASFVASWIIRWKARRDFRDRTLPVRAGLAAAIAQLRTQERFLRYLQPLVLVPLAAGMLLVVAAPSTNRIGEPVSTEFRIGYTLFVLVLVSIVLVGSHYQARRTFRPLREELESWLADLDDIDGAGAA